MEVAEIFLFRHQEISVRNPEGSSLSRARGFTPGTVAQFLVNLQTLNGQNST
jgi:hypothetical protein